MTIKTKYWILVLSMIVSFGCNGNRIENQTVESFPILTGKYMGQKEPGLSPEIFAPTIVSTGMAEINSVFTPDYKEFYYSIRMPNGQLVIMVMKYNDTQWSEPQVASFSGEYSDADPFITYDGNWLYFISKRPIDSTKIAKSDWDIWRTHKDGDKWLEPERLASEINSEADETYPSLTKEGKLYFSSGRIGENNKDIFYAVTANDGFNSPVRLNDTINSHWEGDIYISPEEDYMIFASYGRDAGSGLYISFYQDEQWSLPQRMGKEINMTGREFCPIVSADGNYFFFTSNQSIGTNEIAGKLTYKKIKEDFIKSYNFPQMGKTDVYWVSSELLEEYRNKSR